MTAHSIYIGNDNVLKLDGVKDNDGNFMNAATVTAKIVDRNTFLEVTASGYTAQTLTYVAASNGNYRKDVDKGVTDNIPEGLYFIEWTAVETGRDYKRYDDLIIEKRRI